MLRATLNESVPLQVQVGTGQTDLFARAKIYNISNVLIATISLPHIVEGLYGSTYVFTTEGHYTVVYQLFIDPGFTSLSSFDMEAEAIEVNSDKTNILRILGLTHDNTVIDNNTYDIAGNLITSRIRHYQTKAQAEAAGASGLLNTWLVLATYSGDKLQSYTVVREP